MKANRISILKTAVVAAMSLLVDYWLQLQCCTKTQETTAIKSENNSKSAQADTDLVITVSDITEKVSFYPVEADGTKMEVLAVKRLTVPYELRLIPVRYVTIPVGDTINRME